MRTARAALARDEFQTAENLLLQSVDLSKNSAESNYLLAVVSRRLGKLDQVDPYLRSAARLGWSDSRIELERCLAYAQSGEVEEVEGRLREMVQLGLSDRDAEQVYEALAIGFMASYRLRDAWDCLEFWLQWHPNNLEARMMRADIAERIGKTKLAADEYRAVLAVDPRHRAARVNLGKVLMELGEVSSADQHWTECLELFPDDIAVLTGLAQSKRRLGDMAASIEFGERALTKSPQGQQRADILLEMGQSWMAAGELQKAIDAFTSVLEVAPATTIAHYGLAQLYARSGESDLSAHHRTLAQQVSAQNLRIAELTRGLLNSPGDVELRYELGEILVEQGRTAEGLKWIETVLRMQPEHAASLNLLNSVHEETVRSANSSTDFSERKAAGPVTDETSAE